jgi:hypothetical protein
MSTFNTKELASILKVKPNTIRRGLCINGHYISLRPIKLPNRRLLWSADKVDKLLAENEK